MIKQAGVRRIAGWTVLALAAWTAAGCGGGGGDSSDGTPQQPAGNPTVTATADTLTVQPGASAPLLANDTLGADAATVGATGNVLFTLVTTPPAGLTVADGRVAVDAAMAPGSYRFDYRICQASAGTNCATATAAITVPPPVISAAADSFNLLPGGSGDVLANDRLGGASATAALVSATATTTLPAGWSFSAAGLIGVPAGTASGAYTLGYRICQTSAPANCADAQASITVPAVGTLTGRALDGATGAGVPAVTVTAGGQTATTDASGNFSLPNVATGSRLPVLFRSSTHAESARMAAVTDGASSDVQVRLTRIGGTATLDAGAGGTAGLAGSTAQVTLPAGGLQRADGSAASGNVTVALTPLAVGSDSSLMPGDFNTVVAGALTPIESFGALNVTLTDSAGSALNLRSGQSATIRIPASSRSASLPATIPLFYFDTATGNWVQEGTATLVGNGANAYYQGSVNHFSTWNADQVYNTVQVTGCVADTAGNRLAGARVLSDGVDYSGTSTAVTDAAGNFTIAMRRNGQATLTGLSGSRLTNTRSVGPFTADSALSGCLTVGQTGGGVTMKLTWGATPDDLDSHLYAPNGSHVYYSNDGSLTAAPFASLDVDDTSSFGPEVVTVTRLMVGTYRYLVHNFSGHGSGPIASSGARVELNVPGRTLELFVPPASGETAGTPWWSLFEMDVDSRCTVTLRRVNGYAAAPPSVTSSTAVYCTAP